MVAYGGHGSGVLVGWLGNRHRSYVVPAGGVQMRPLFDFVFYASLVMMVGIWSMPGNVYLIGVIQRLFE